MTGIDTIVNEPAVQAIGWALLHFVWQGTLIAGVAAVALRLLRQSAADVRYVVATIALSLMATLPVVTGVQVWRAAASDSSTAMPQRSGRQPGELDVVLGIWSRDHDGCWTGALEQNALESQ